MFTVERGTSLLYRLPLARRTIHYFMCSVSEEDVGSHVRVIGFTRTQSYAWQLRPALALHCKFFRQGLYPLLSPSMARYVGFGVQQHMYGALLYRLEFLLAACPVKLCSWGTYFRECVTLCDKDPWKQAFYVFT